MDDLSKNSVLVAVSLSFFYSFCSNKVEDVGSLFSFPMGNLTNSCYRRVFTYTGTNMPNP
jgi:hypothetical protein